MGWVGRSPFGKDFALLSAQKTRPLPYLPGLDGLRGLAVAAVVLYHAGQTWLRGGFLGVEVFFVISGYIITAGLLANWRESGEVAFRAFWTRRALRLLPALFAMLAIVLAGSALFLPDRFEGVRTDSLYAAIYVTNWKLIFEHLPYFESFGPPPLLKHLWSLAVEEQFYIVWPVLFALLVRLLRPRWAGAVLVAGALASAGLMALLYNDPYATSRIYYGTDTRACGLLLGAALAFAVRPGDASSRLTGAAATLVGLAGFAGLTALILLLGEYDSMLYRGGFLLTDVATAAMIVAMCRPSGLLARAIGVLPVRWVGVRSYGIYLWHWPLLLVFRPDTGSSGADLALRLGAILLAAAVSYALIEKPAREGGLARLVRGMTAPAASSWSYRKALGTFGMALGLVSFTVSVTAARAPSARASRSSQVEIPLMVDMPAPASPDLVEEPLFALTQGMPEPAPEPTPEPPPDPAPAPPPAPPPLPVVGVIPIPEGLRIMAIGDSVMLGASRQMVYLMGSMDLDANVGRQVSNGLSTLRAHIEANGKPDVAVIGLGNNGGFTAREFDQIMELLADVKVVVFVNVHVPRPWEESNNKVIAQGVAAYPNAVLVDWKSATQDHDEVFGEDKVHLTGSGIRLYAGLVADAIVANWK